jgi:hypothetical protein
MILSLILCAFAGAVARRIAGGVLRIPGGTLVARALGGIGLGAVLWAVAPAMPLLVLAWVPALFFLGMAAGFPPGGMVPRTPGHVGGISQQHGWALIGPLALWAAAHGMPWWPLVVAAAAVGPVYWLATLWQPTIPWLGFNKGGLPDPPAFAEPFVGVCLGLALGLAVTGGVR